MGANNAWTTRGAIDYVGRFEEYRETVGRLFPNLPKDYVDARSISRVDALSLGYFLECYPRKAVVVDIGPFVSVSAFHFAGHPKVLRVISIGPNPTIVDEIDGALDSRIDPEPLRNLTDLEVAQAALAEFGDEHQKIQFRVGSVGNSRVSSQGGSLDGLERVEIPALELSDGVSLLAFVDGVHTKEGVLATLQAIFEKNPHAVAILDDCRGSWGPFVQAGVVSFMEGAQKKYHFQLFGDLGPSIATSDLGIVYPDLDAAEAERTLVEFSELFSERLDLLRLLRREEELISAVSWYKNAADKYKSEADRLRRRNSRLINQDPGHDNLADTPPERTLRVPGIKRLVSSKLMQRLVPRRLSGTDGHRPKGAGRPQP